MKNVDLLVGAKYVELLAFREHPYRKGQEVIKHVGEIKDYEYIVNDTDEKCILFLKKEKEGQLMIVDRIQHEVIVNISKSSFGEVKIIVD